MSPTRTHRIILHKLNLTGRELQIPVADISAGIPGPTILITGGMDGDEYTGIRTAYDLIDYYTERQFPGRIIIVPIVNVPGFYDAKSQNPIDRKYPKYIFPGNKHGTATEQLIDWLRTNFMTDAAVWIDLHSGAMTERLQPFIWAFETGNKSLNRMTLSILKASCADLIVYENAPFLSKAARLASCDCLYLIFESGDRGEQKLADRERLFSWAKKTVAVIQGEIVPERQIEAHKNVTFYRAKFDGMWLPEVDLTRVEKGTIGGRLTTLDRKKTDIVTIKDSGTILWMKSALFAKKDDELLAIATGKRIV